MYNTTTFRYLKYKEIFRAPKFDVDECVGVQVKEWE